MPIDALSVLCAQQTSDLLAIAKFLFNCVLTTVFYMIKWKWKFKCIVLPCESSVISPTVSAAITAALW